jgi:hypothetical protein
MEFGARDPDGGKGSWVLGARAGLNSPDENQWQSVNSGTCGIRGVIDPGGDGKAQVVPPIPEHLQPAWRGGLELEPAHPAAGGIDDVDEAETGRARAQAHGRA